MVAHVSTVAFQGIEATPVDVQVQLMAGLPAFTIVGLPDKAVGESRERVRSALAASGLALPAKRVVINLAPADLPKEGSHYDLPIALGIMIAMGALPQDAMDGLFVIGELSLDGTTQAVSGALPAAIAANREGCGLLCPAASGAEAAWAGAEMEILAPKNLIQISNHTKGTQIMTRPEPGLADRDACALDFSDVKGQETAKRALEVAAAGGHNILFVGPPGAGKSMLASRLPSILPPLEPHEMLEVSMIASIAGELKNGHLSNVRPFRAPHHSASMAALIGGGHKARPGEAALAHHGVLFLDELPEFSPQVLDSLRQPLEAGETVIARANHRICFPSRFQLVAAMNPCRCGMAGEPGHTCRRGAKCADDYQARISGPFMDRIDICFDVPAVSALDLFEPGTAENSASVARRVASARTLQAKRIHALSAQEPHLLKRNLTNATISPALIDKLILLDQYARTMLKEAAEKLSLSARAYHRIVKVARTLADLEQSETVKRLHVAEAISYRSRQLEGAGV